MAQYFVLTDEQSEVLGYKRLKYTPNNSPFLRSDAASLVQAVTATTAGGTSIQCTRQTSGTPVYGDQTLQWISEPLDGSLNPYTSGSWTANLWALEKTAGDHVGLQAEVFIYRNGALLGTPLLNISLGSELTATITPYVFSGNAAGVAAQAGDRLVLKVNAVNQGTMVADSMQLDYNGLYAGGDGDSWLQCPDAVVLQAVTPTSTVNDIRALLHDETVVLCSATELQKAVDDALKRFSADRQRLTSQFYSGDAATFGFPLPRDWIWTFSDLLEIEYPAISPGSQGAGNVINPGGASIAQTRKIMGSPDDWEIVQFDVNYQPLRQIWFRTFIPDSGTNNVCLRYTTRQRHDTLVDTIPHDDYQAFCWLIASYASNIVASKFAAVNDSTITADATDYKSRHAYWSAQAAEFMALYDDHIRGEEPPASPSSRQQGWHTDLSFYDLDRLTHPRRWRTSRSPGAVD